LVTYSEQFDNAAWSKQNGITATANTATSPDGFTNADTLEKVGGSGGVGFYYIVASATSNTTNTFSVFAKYKTGSGIIWLLGKNSGSFAFFNLQTGSALSATAGMTTKIENYGNGWYRCSFTQDYTGASDYTFGVGVSLVDGTPNYNATTAATQGVYIYGAQFEAGAYATSYIPTTAASVTRVADAASKTGISSLIGQTEGTLFGEFTTSGLPAVDQYFFSLSDGTTTNVIYLGFYSTILVARIVNAGSLVCNINVGLSTNTTYKIAFAYKGNDCKLYINGVDSGTDTSATIPAVSQFGMNQINEIAAYKVNQALVFKTRLTNAQLAELTTL
jgi:hypothetical protein